MISSFSCGAAFSSIRERWNVVRSRPRTSAAGPELDSPSVKELLYAADQHALIGLYQPQKILTNNLYGGLLREETMEKARVGPRYEDEPRHQGLRRVVDHAPEPRIGEPFPRIAPLAEQPSRASNPQPNTHLPLDDNTGATAVREATSANSSQMFEPKTRSTSAPSRPVQYTPGGRAIPVIDNSRHRPFARSAPSHSALVVGQPGENSRGQRETYTRITPLPPSKAQMRRRGRGSPTTPSSMARTPISEDDETALQTIEGSSANHPPPAERQDKSEQGDRESTSTSSSVESSGEHSMSTGSGSIESDTSVESSKVQTPKRVDYIEDTPLFPIQRQLPRREQRVPQLNPGPAGYPRASQLRGLPYRSPGMPGSRASQPHPSHVYPPAMSRGERRSASMGHYPAAGRVPSNPSLHQRTMLSQWRAQMAAETAQVVAQSPRNAAGSDTPAAAESSLSAGPTAKEPSRERRTSTGSSGKSSASGSSARTKPRPVSEMDAREIELEIAQHLEELRRLQGGVN